jgi:GAF domain-containing protein
MLSNLKDRLDELSSRQQVLAEALDPRKESSFLDYYVRVIPRLLNAERCSIFIHDPANRKVWLKTGTAVRERGIEVSVQDSIVGEVIASGKPVIASELQSRDGAHRRIDTTTGFVTREVICVPIRSSDGARITGAIEVLNRKGGGRFTEEDQSLLLETGEHFQGIVESIYLGQEAVGMSRNLVTTATRALVAAGVMAIGTFGFVFLLIYAAMQSRLQ